MGCRIPIRQMPSGILFLKDCKGLRSFWQIGICQPNTEFRFGKCRQAYIFLKVSDIIGKSEFANPIPNSDSANTVRHTFFKGLRHYWQIGICQPIIGLRHYWQIGICQPINGR